MTKVKVVICPYCGDTQPASERCRKCGGLFEPLSRQATHNAMGPWYIRDENTPFQPGCSYETLVKLIDRGRISKYTIIRGPTTRQFWTIARHVAGVAHLLGFCHNCDARVDKNDLGCPSCGAPFGAYLDRNYLGLPEPRPLPWEAESDASSDSWTGYFGAPRPEARGVSSFGSDEEIGAGGSRFSGQSGIPGGAVAQKREVAKPQVRMAETVAAPAARATLTQLLDADEAYSAAKQRSLERRLADQQRYARVLLVLLLVTLVVAVLAAFDVLTLLRPNGAQPQQQEAAAPADKSAAPNEDVRFFSDESEGSTIEESRGDGRDERTVPPESPRNTPPAAPQSLTPAYQAEYDRALQLVERSADESLALDDRLSRLGEAIQILKHIREKAPPERLPAGLDDLIAEQERQFRKLELEKFFPD